MNNLDHLTKDQLIEIIEEMRTDTTNMTSAYSQAKAFNAFIEGTQEILYLIDRNGKFILSEGKGLSKIGLQPGQVVGTSVYELYKDFPIITTSIKKAFKGRSNSQVVNFEDISFKFWNTPVSDKNGKTTGVIGMAIDITDKKLAETALKESELKFQKIMESIPLPLVYVDNKGKFIFRNKRFVDTFGYDEKKMADIETWWIKAYPDEEYRNQLINEWRVAVEEAQRTGNDIRSGVFNVTCNNGDVKQVIISGISFEDDLLATMVDITDLKNAELELELQIKRQLDILEGTNAGTWDWNIVTGDVVINERWAEIIGYNTNDINPVNFKFFTNTIHPDDISNLKDHLDKHIKGELDYYDVIFRQKHKQNFWVWVNARGKIAERDEDNKPIRMTGIHLDVSLRHKAELELKKHKEHLEELVIERTKDLEAERKQVVIANNLKSEFLSNMSHELRTPLNSILALSSVLMTEAKDKLDPDQNNYLSIIERNGKRLLTLINDILDLSKIEAGKMDINPIMISPSIILRLVVENIIPIANEKNLQVNIEIPDDLPMVETDESRLHQILLNIIGNAVKFTNEGYVSISASASDNDILVVVKDTGIGISKENLPHIFEEFRQADGTLARNFEGTGLGLSIVNKLSRLLGCKIIADSNLGVGTTFEITIPFKWSAEDLMTES